MSLHTLDLDPLQLTYHAGRLRLSVISRAEFKFPTGIQLQQIDVAKALATGTLWVGHARICPIDIQISFTDGPLDFESKIRILEAIKRRMIGTNLWPQLSLSPSLKTSQSEDLESTKSHLSILLNQSSSSTTSAAYPRGWILENIDVKPPTSVLSVQFNGLRIQLDFSNVHTGASHVPKKPKLWEDEPKSILLDRLGDIENSHFAVFDEALDGLTCNLRRWVAGVVEYSDIPTISHGIPNPKRKTACPSNLPSGTEVGASFSSIKRNGRQAKKPNQPHIFTDDIRLKLQAWLQSNIVNPYPDNQVKLRLMEETGLNRKQLNRFFYRARGHLSQPVDEQVKDPALLEDNIEIQEHFNETNPFQQEHIPVSTAEQDLADFGIFDQNILLFDETDLDSGDDMLSFLDDEIPALTSPTSRHTPATISSLSTNKRTAPPQMTSPETPGISPYHSSMLSSAAINIIIAGSACKRNIPNISLQKTFPKYPLSTLIPSLFCPAFQPIMAHNSRFLPTISQAISSSWVRNCQGSGLRRKLSELSHLSPPGADFGQVAPSGELGSTERLRAVVQRRIWSMMQSKLSDTAALRKVKWGILDSAGTDSPTDGHRRPRVKQTTKIAFNKSIDEAAEDDDDELLFGKPCDDDGLLSYFDEMEKREVEKQTDEMLFGSGKYEEDFNSEIELLLDENNQETMLV